MTFLFLFILQSRFVSAGNLQDHNVQVQGVVEEQRGAKAEQVRQQQQQQQQQQQNLDKR